MPDFILHLETSAKVCSVALSDGPDLIASEDYPIANSHSSVLAVLIKKVLSVANVPLRSLSAVALSAGPGSYTGLRIGASTAKGLCYALDIPLLSVDTLRAMAFSASRSQPGFDFYIPMIDARRMEVYTGVYSAGNEVLTPSNALIIDGNPYLAWLERGRVLYIGNGVEKCLHLLSHNQAESEILAFPRASHMPVLAHNLFILNKFEDLAYYEPNYVKAFWTPAGKGSGA